MNAPLNTTQVMPEPSPSPEAPATLTPANQSLLGLVSFSILAAMTRLAKDGDQAPNTEFHIEHARMSARAFREFQHLERFAGQFGTPLSDLAAQFAGLFDDVDIRPRPSDWWERSVITCVVVGIFADAFELLNEQQQLFDEDTWLADFGQGAWVRDRLAELTENNPQLADRLSLWARRVAGESVSLLRATLFTYADLAIDPETADVVVAEVTDKHRQRLEQVNLKA